MRENAIFTRDDDSPAILDCKISCKKLRGCAAPSPGHPYSARAKARFTRANIYYARANFCTSLYGRFDDTMAQKILWMHLGNAAQNDKIFSSKVPQEKNGQIATEPNSMSGPLQPTMGLTHSTSKNFFFRFFFFFFFLLTKWSILERHFSEWTPFQPRDLSLYHK
jgi:hypothetical protein